MQANESHTVTHRFSLLKGYRRTYQTYTAAAIIAAATTDKTVLASNAAEGALRDGVDGVPDGVDGVPDGVDGVPDGVDGFEDPVEEVNGTPPQTPLPHITVPVMVLGAGIDGTSKDCESASHPLIGHVPPPP